MAGQVAKAVTKGALHATTLAAVGEETAAVATTPDVTAEGGGKEAMVAADEDVDVAATKTNATATGRGGGGGRTEGPWR